MQLKICTRRRSLAVLLRLRRLPCGKALPYRQVLFSFLERLRLELPEPQLSVLTNTDERAQSFQTLDSEPAESMNQTTLVNYD